MPTPNFQLSVELTNIASALITSSAYKDVLEFARTLRKSGSDIVVEEDLANVFGRAKIDRVLEDLFREKMKGTTIVPLHPTCSTMSLQSGPGPTVARAMREQDRRYMSAVIQLSFLGILFARDDLASSIAECMASRTDQGVEDNSGPGYEDVHGTLEACSSQTSNFNWQPMIENVESRIQNHFSYHDRSDRHRKHPELPPHILLACMDYFFLIQSLPEDRIMFCKSETGIIPLALWAHHILGLTVEIRSQSSESLFFGQGRTGQVIIMWRPDATPSSESNDSEILLLDKSMKVVLSTTPDTTRISEIITQERHNLEGFGSTMLHRWFNRTLPAPPDDSTIYLETIEVILALVLYTSQTVERKKDEDKDLRIFKEDNFGFRSYSLEPWRVFRAVDIIFHEHMSRLDDKETKKSGQVVQKHFEELNKAKPNILFELPASVQLHIDKLSENSDAKIVRDILKLTSMVFIFSHVEELGDCRALPLCFGSQAEVVIEELIERLYYSYRKAGVDCNSIFVSILRLLVGQNFQDGDDKNMFLVSDFGWSVYLDCVGDKDPCEVNPHLVHIRPGVPVNNRGERKSRIRDAEIPDGWYPVAKVLDEGQPRYQPRCVFKVTERAEYYVSRNKEFWSSLGYKVDRGSESDDTFTNLFASYRKLHEALWDINMLQTEACQHPLKSLATARLGRNVVTLDGYFEFGDWTEPDDRAASHRICICLVKDDPRARWLACNFLVRRKLSRRILLRSKKCCEDCALYAISSLPGKWFLII